MDQAMTLLLLANRLAVTTPGFFTIKGPGRGNHATNDFVRELRRQAELEFGEDYSEQVICGSSKSAVDYYFPSEATIVEVALGLRNPNTEFEKDILKALVAKDCGNPVKRLFFIAKPGGQRKCQQPGRKDFAAWLNAEHGIEIDVHDLDPSHQAGEIR